MVTRFQHNAIHSFKVNYSGEKVTAFGGLVLAERLARRLGFWTGLEKVLPVRRGYDWLTIVKSLSMGLLTGARGAQSAEDLREDEALLSLIGLPGAPEEATVWRALKGLGAGDIPEILFQTQLQWATKILKRSKRPGLLRDGFFPVFMDGSLLEGSRRREGTKRINEKGSGLLWTGIFAGPLLAAQGLAGKGEGEESCARDMLGQVCREVLEPTNLLELALLLADSLHGDGPTFDEAESLGLLYVIGANKLSATAKTLNEQPEVCWQDTGANEERGWSASGMCVCYLQCEGWEKKRTLVGMRYKRKGEMIWNYTGVATNLEEADVAHIMEKQKISFAQAIWRLYDHKMGMETQFKDLLSDLGLHHPPCQEIVRNRGFYSAAALAHTLARGVDLIGQTAENPGETSRKDGKKRKRAKPRTMRVWRIRRRLFTLPARIARHGRKLTITLLGLNEKLKAEIQNILNAIQIC